jgi:actin cytoskeleton-regulatory complex protein SLA1
VQKWQASDIQSTRIEKGKHVHIELSGSNAAELHFHAGSKEVAEAIIHKLQETRTDARVAEEEVAGPAAVTSPERPRSSAAKSVHFDNSAPEIIPDHEDEEPTGQEEESEEPEDTLGAGERAVVLYDFSADGDDEMTVHEGETLLVLERDTDEWWKCKNAQGDEGVVPANYLEVFVVALCSLSFLSRDFVACARLGWSTSLRCCGERQSDA